MFLSSVHICRNYPSFDANSFRDSISIKKFEFRSGPTFCWAWLSPNCLHRISADDKRCQSTNPFIAAYRTDIFANCLPGEMQHKVAFHQGLAIFVKIRTISIK